MKKYLILAFMLMEILGFSYTTGVLSFSNNYVNAMEIFTVFNSNLDFAVALNIGTDAENALAIGISYGDKIVRKMDKKTPFGKMKLVVPTGNYRLSLMKSLSTDTLSFIGNLEFGNKLMGFETAFWIDTNLDYCLTYYLKYKNIRSKGMFMPGHKISFTSFIDNLEITYIDGLGIAYCYEDTFFVGITYENGLEIPLGIYNENHLIFIFKPIKKGFYATLNFTKF